MQTSRRTWTCALPVSVISLAVIFVALCGCSHVHSVSPTSASDIEDLNRAVRKKRVSVELGTSALYPFGATLAAEGVRVAADTTLLTLLLDPGDITAIVGNPRYASRSDTVLATSAISHMSAPSALRGGLDGAILGLGFGAAFGALLGWLQGDSWFGPSEYALGLGVIGFGAGAVTGVVLGSNEIYEFEHQ